MRSGGRRVTGCFTKDLRVQVRGSKRARLLHADVMIGRRRVERLLNLPTARGQRGGPVTLSGIVKRQQIKQRRPLPPTRARGDGGRPEAHAGPDAAPLPVSTRRR